MIDTNKTQTRLEMARATAFDLLNELECGDAPVAQSLMKAARLARLLRDEDAQNWLNLETRGYPSAYNFADLGTCRKYVLDGGRLLPDGKYYSQSLPKIEAESFASKSGLVSKIAKELPISQVENFTAANATIRVLNSEAKRQEAIQSIFSSWASLLAAMRGAVHSYASDTCLALELGDVAEDFFESARRDVDVFVRANCPVAAQQLVAISERLRQADPESLSAALTSCRRLLATVADAVYPPSTTPYFDHGGNKRKVGQEEYKNRLLAYLERCLSSASTNNLVIADVEHLAARIDAVYDKTCKGVHADVDLSEARLTVIGTYLLIAEIARAGELGDVTKQDQNMSSL